MNAKDIDRRMEEILVEMRGMGDLLFGSVTTNRNRKERKRKEGVYVSPAHYTFNCTGANGEKVSKRIRPEDVERVRELVAAGRRWKELAREYQRLANQLTWEGGAEKNSGCPVRGCGRLRKSSENSAPRLPRDPAATSPDSTAT